MGVLAFGFGLLFDVGEEAVAEGREQGGGVAGVAGDAFCELDFFAGGCVEGGGVGVGWDGEGGELLVRRDGCGCGCGCWGCAVVVVVVGDVLQDGQRQSKPRNCFKASWRCLRLWMCCLGLGSCFELYCTWMLCRRRRRSSGLASR